VACDPGVVSHVPLKARTRRPSSASAWSALDRAAVSVLPLASWAAQLIRTMDAWSRRDMPTTRNASASPNRGTLNPSRHHRADAGALGRLRHGLAAPWLPTPRDRACARCSGWRRRTSRAEQGALGTFQHFHALEVETGSGPDRRRAEQVGKRMSSRYTPVVAGVAPKLIEVEMPRMTARSPRCPGRGTSRAGTSLR